MISTNCSHAILIVIGVFPGQAAVLESYEGQWENLPEGITSIWEYSFKIEGAGADLSLWEVFHDLPANPGFWVWEGSLAIEAKDKEPNFMGKWRRATLDEVTSWDESTRSIFDRLTNEYA